MTNRTPPLFRPLGTGCTKEGLEGNQGGGGSLARCPCSGNPGKGVWEDLGKKEVSSLLPCSSDSLARPKNVQHPRSIHKHTMGVCDIPMVPELVTEGTRDLWQVKGSLMDRSVSKPSLCWDPSICWDVGPVDLETQSLLGNSNPCLEARKVQDGPVTVPT
jgi:hypothetical protein